MVIEAYAKINWSLDITGLRDDGYHIMDMLMQPVSLSDKVILEPGKKIEITTGGWPPTRADESNLAFRAAKVLKEKSGYPDGARIHVEKHIPVGAGMGGGSSDASAVLFGLNRMWNIGLPGPELEKIGLSLGADVPFFLRGGLTRTQGIGEDLESHDCLHNYWLIVIQPCPGLSTARVFSLWHRESVTEKPDTEKALHALESGNLPVLCDNIRNVLQPVSESLRPEIVGACRCLKDEGASAALMTGSGSAVFGVFRSSAYAQKAYQKLRTKFKTIFLCHTQYDSMRILEDRRD